MHFAKGSFTRPADTTAYASGDQMANSTTAGSVVPISLNPTSGGRRGKIRHVMVRRTAASVTGLAIRCHIFTASPTVTAGDNAAMVIATGTANYLGYIDADTPQALTSGACVWGWAVAGKEIPLRGNETIYALLEARGAIAPASGEVFSLELGSD